MRSLWHLHAIDWLRELTAAELELLRAEATAREHAPRERVFAPTPHPHSVYLLEKGMVRIFRVSDGGAETTFGYVQPGEIFGEVAALGDLPRESFAEAVEASVAWRIPSATFRSLMTHHADLAFEVTRQIGSRLKRIESRVEDLVFRSVPARIARVLTDLAEDLPRDETSAEVPLTQAELATLVGATRQTVNAALADLEQRGLIARLRGRIRLRDPTALRAEIARSGC